MAELRLVPEPDFRPRIAMQLRMLLDQVDAGLFGDDPDVAVVINHSEGIEVRGLAQVDSVRAIAILTLGQAWLVGQTLNQMEDNDV